MSHEQLPISFKVRTQGRYTGAKGGEVKPGGGGAGALWYVDKTFTVATHQDQWLLAPVTQGTPTTFPMSPDNHQSPKLKYLSVCSGMEAASVAWHTLGWEPVGFSEIEPFPAAILAHRFPNTPNHGDLTQHHTWPIEPGTVDLLVGGTPCQSFSVAGLRKGMQDPRGNLALTFLGLADRLRPRWIVWENVPGVLSSNGGRDFGAFIGALGQLGFGYAWRVLDAQHFGVPQRRRRVFVVATSTGDGRLAGEVLSLPEGLRGYLEARRKKGQGVAPGPSGGVDADGLQSTVGTLCADTHPGAYSGQDAYTGRLIPCPDNDKVGALCARDYKGVGSQYVSEGKCIPESQPIAIQGTIIGRGENAGPQGVGARQGGPMFTLTKTDIHGVAQTLAFDGYNQTLSETSQTIRADKSDGDHVGMVIQPIQHCSDVAPTVTSSGPPDSRTGNERVEAEAVVAHPTVTTCTGQRQGCSSEAMASLSALEKAGAFMPMAVRRLTPVECERLQGFPDNWSRIPWKGKPEEECPDGPRYKACGNSMAVPVMRWIGRQIAEVEARHAQGKTA